MSHAPRGGSGANGDLISRQSKATSSSSDGRWPEPPAARARSPPGVQLLALARVSSARPPSVIVDTLVAPEPLVTVVDASM